jgi:hypothetical protein
MADTGRTGQTFRAKGPVRFAGAIGLIGAIVLVILGASAHGPHAAAGRVFSYVFSVFMVAFSIRALNLGILATKDQIRIRNLFITRWVQWSEIEGFSFGQLRLFPAVGIVTLRDGRKMAITGISYGRAARKGVRANAASQIAELNQVLEEHRAGATRM